MSPKSNRTVAGHSSRVTLSACSSPPLPLVSLLCKVIHYFGLIAYLRFRKVSPALCFRTRPAPAQFSSPSQPAASFPESSDSCLARCRSPCLCRFLRRQKLNWESDFRRKATLGSSRNQRLDTNSEHSYYRSPSSKVSCRGRPGPK